MHSTKGAMSHETLWICHLERRLREGKGSVSTESRALETYPYTFFSRLERDEIGLRHMRHW